MLDTSTKRVCATCNKIIHLYADQAQMHVLKNSSKIITPNFQLQYNKQAIKFYAIFTVL